MESKSKKENTLTGEGALELDLCSDSALGFSLFIYKIGRVVCISRNEKI